MKKIVLITLLCVFSGLMVSLQAQLRKVPAEITNAFKTKYPTAENVEWSDKLTGFQATFTMNGDKYESRFNNKGVWEYTEKTIAETQLPAAVTDGLKKSKYADWEIKSTTLIEYKDGIQYRLLARKTDIEKKYLFFDPSGRLLKDSITL